MSEIESTHLGKQSAYPQSYNRNVLVAVPRHINRTQYEINSNDLPFVGVDVWHAYEFSFLTKSGLPVASLLKITYPANSPFLVESKSLKLYLNSFNMETFGHSKHEGLKLVLPIIQTDLQAILGCALTVSAFEYYQPVLKNDFLSYSIIEDMPTMESVKCEVFTEDSQLLGEGVLSGEVRWGTHLLRSNCKVTHQPDWGSLFVNMAGQHIPAPDNLLRYVVSLRSENHFHEEICELVFIRLLKMFKPYKLTVSCLYTRRGGIDINPVRSIDPSGFPKNLGNPNELSKTIFRQ